MPCLSSPLPLRTDQSTLHHPTYIPAIAELILAPILSHPFLLELWTSTNDLSAVPAHKLRPPNFWPSTFPKPPLLTTHGTPPRCSHVMQTVMYQEILYVARPSANHANVQVVQTRKLLDHTGELRNDILLIELRHVIP